MHPAALLFLLLAGEPVTVHLKDGRVVKGHLEAESPEGVTLNRKGVRLSVSRSEIRRITKDNTPPNPAPEPTPPPVPEALPEPPHKSSSDQTPSEPAPEIEHATQDATVKIGDLTQQVLDKGPSKDAASSLWTCLSKQKPEFLESLDLESSRGVALLVDVAPDQVPHGWWPALVSTLKADDAKKLACQALLKLPREKSWEMAIDMLADLEGPAHPMIKDVATQMVENMPDALIPALRERMTSLALAGKPHSFVIARLCFKASWEKSEGDWLAFAQSNDPDIRVEALNHMAIKKAGLLHAYAIDELYLSSTDAPTRMAILKLWQALGESQGARHPSILKEYLKDARSAESADLKVKALERLRLETKLNFAAGSKKWEENLR
ncbi:MAG: hypothetical protein AB7F75_07175 [Planctomycetota bacterium]